MKALRFVPVIVIMLFTDNVSAADISYDFVDFAYQSLDLNGVDGDGYALDLSWSFLPSTFGLLRHKSQSFEEGSDRADWTVMDIGAGGHWAIGPRADFIFSGGLVRGRLAFADIEVSIPGFRSGSDDDTGFFLETGVRVMATDQLELHASAYYRDAFDDSQTNIEIGARYLVTPNLSLNAAYLDEDDVDGFNVGARFNF